MLTKRNKHSLGRWEIHSAGRNALSSLSRMKQG